MRAASLEGQRFHRLFVLSRSPRSDHGKVWWQCRCDCGASVEVPTGALRGKSTRSCGCWKREALARPKATHGQSSRGGTRKASATYSSWQAMIARCERPSNVAYERYGGRGVVICDRWRSSFEAFFEDMGKRPAGKTLDRFPDANGNYEPGNVRWATITEQNRNTRAFKVTRAIALEVLGRLEHGERAVSICRRMGLSAPTVSEIRTGRLWAELPRASSGQSA